MGYRAVRTERWKYIHYLELEGMDELYDLEVDPAGCDICGSKREHDATDWCASVGNWLLQI